MSPISEAQKRATEKYNAKTYDRIQIRVKKGQKDIIFDYANSRGESVNEFISRAIYETMERDKDRD